MAGGTFDRAVGKDRPGTYINFKGSKAHTIRRSERGTVLLPLAEHDYGPAGEFITLEDSAPDAQTAKLGYSVSANHPSMLLVREAFKNARRVVAYIPSQGAKATATAGSLTATARYGGKRGNDLRFSSTENPLGGYDVTVFLGSEIKALYEQLTTVPELAAQDDDWLVFSGTGDLVAVAGVNLTGGTSGTLTAADVTAFLDKSEAVRWNAMAFPFEPTGDPGDPIPGLQEAVAAKIRYLREDAGRYRKAVMANYATDYERIVNVTNSVVLRDGTALTTAQATAWVAGVDAGATKVQSNTYVPYEGAVGIVGAKTHDEAVQAIRNGEFFFTLSETEDSGQEIIVEYDINSLVTFEPPKAESWRKNRVLRVMDEFAETLMLDFPPNRFDNDPTGWDIMEGLGREALLRFYEDGAIKNVDFDADFLVDRAISTGDEVYFDVGLQPVDSAEKLFFTVRTR